MAAGLTQEELAERAQLSVRAISDMERGRTKRPYHRSVLLLCDALSLSGAERAQLVNAARKLSAVEHPDLAEPVVRGAPVPRQLPASSPHFSGRAAELKALSGLLEQAAETGRAAVVCVVTGMAGVGKTTLAIHWAHQVAEAFPDGQLYINLRGFDPSGPPLTAAEVLRGFLHALNVRPERVPASLSAREAMYRSILADRRILVILDNASDAGQVRPLLPGGARCRTVVTSRQPLVGLVAVEGAQPVGLDVLTAAEAEELLASRLGAGWLAAEPGAVRELIELCARLPLALSIAAARATMDPGMSVTQLAGQLRDQSGRLDVLSTDDAEASVRAAFSWSYGRLSKTAARMFLLLSLPTGLDISGLAAASLAGISRPDAHVAIEELIRAHLIVEHLPGRYSCHDLLRVFAAERATTEISLASRVASTRQLLDWYLQTAACAARMIDPARRHVGLEAPASHGEPLAFGGYHQALGWLEEERVNLTSAVRQAAEIGAHDIAWKLPIELWDLFVLRSYWSEWIAADKIALTSAQALDDQDAQGWILNQLAVVFQQSGDSEAAIDCLRRALDLRRQIGDRRGEASVLANLGRTYSETGRLMNSMTCLQQARAIFQETGQLLLHARTLMNISSTQRRLGLLEEAKDSAQEAANTCERLDDQLTHAGSLGELAAACRLLGRPAEAAAHCARAVALHRQTGDRVGLAEVLMALGAALQDSGDTAQAVERWHEARAIFEEVGDPQVTEVTVLLQNARSS
jgi:tetratricopeptide (TPR) repeat protein/transcriptional regulator with XRE-family HTH domain